MTENVQCPVCTLFLHAGMNLSDHLETHPKEQVIKALVLMTISGVGGGIANASLAAALAGGENKPETDSKSTLEKEPLLNCNSSASNSSSSLTDSSATCASNSSLNFAKTFSPPAATVTATATAKTLIAPVAKSQKQIHLEATIASVSSGGNDSVGNRSSSSGSLGNSGGGGKAILNQHLQTVNLSQSYQRNIPTTNTNVNETSPVMPTDFSVFAADHYQQQRQQQQHHQQQSNSVSQLQQQQQRHSGPLSAPPPPPLPGKPNQIPINVHELQQRQPQQQHTLLTPTTTATHRHQHVHTHKHQQQQQQHHQQQQQQPHHHQAQQNFKIVYSSTLPPTPQLQLFSYQPTPQPQHQKPPPAYGTAISQIRSQNNQNKKNAAIAIQQHPHHHQNQQHMHVRAQSHLLPPPLSHPPPSIADTASTSKSLFQTKQTEFSPPPPPPPQPPQTPVNQQLKFMNEKPIQNYYQHFVSNISNNSNSNNITSPKFLSTSVRVASSSSTVAEAPPPPSPQMQPQAQMQSLVGSPSSSNRQTSSPFTNMASQSPSSVLRYAESPVAHYLERDNGDFIVQELPKHIVECVEKDNGEFSVIERIYQSPLSVLHIHDDDEDVGNGDNKIKEEKPEVAPDADDNAAEVDVKEMSIDQNVEPSDDGEEFVSITSESEHEREEECKGTKPEACGKEDANENVNNGNLNMELSISSTATAAGTLNSNSIVPSTGPVVAKKKSTKNSVTVISDVHLNLNEYLDLVGTILASNSMVKDNMTRSKPIPLVKVEKIEPLDEDEMEHQPEQQQNTDIIMHLESAASLTSTTIIEPPTNIANKNETEELVANSCSKNKTRFLNESNEKPPECRGEHDAITVTCSSHVTSVIRMATTSQHQTSQQQQEPHKFEYDNDAEMLGITVEISSATTAGVATAGVATANTDNEENVAEDLSQPQLKTEEVMDVDVGEKEPSLIRTNNPPPPPALKRGPKKLVIKPKITTKTDTNANKPADKAEAYLSVDKPTTSAMAQDNLYAMEKQEQEEKEEEEEEEQQQALDALPQNIVIKSEPNTNAYDSSNNSSTILEQQLKLGSQQTESKILSAFTEAERLKVERDFQHKILRQMNSSKNTNAANENVVNDAHVLLDFAANSINRCPATSSAINFLSSSSIFTTPLATTSTKTATTASTNANSNSLPTSLRCDDDYVPADIVQEIVISSSYSSQSASDVALNITTQSTPAASDSNDQQQQQHHKHYQQQQTFTDYPFSFLYGGGSSAAATTGGTHGGDTKGNFSPIYQQAHDATTAATLASGSTTSVIIEDSTSAQASSSHHQHQHNRFDAVHNTVTQWYNTGSTANSDFEAALAVDCSAAVDGDVGKYLDLDTCKREHIVGIQAAPSSTSSSFTAATESSLAGGCTTDALNIRTDEKMPAKGEISEQESNCDIENSWSQPMYSDLSARFFKSSFPGIFQQENVWNQDELFTIQDLSAPTTAAANANNRSTNKSFDFRLPLEATTSAPTIGNNHIQLFGQHNDVLPSSSTATSTNKKKRKRDVHTNKATITRMQPTATVTSQQMLQQQLHPTHLYAHHNIQQHQLQPTTSAALLAGPSNAAANAATNSAVTVTLQQKQRKKIYQCPNCAAEFPKLKERNSHMIVEHNYVRQNRRLICYDAAASRGLNVASATTTATITTADLAAAGMASSSANILLQTQNNIECMEDSKQGIVKIEIENIQQQSLPTTIGSENINAKTELIDEKEGISLVPATSSVGGTAEAANSANVDIDRKPNLQQITVTTPATKLAALYRMLVSFNISTLKQNQILTELEQKEIETSIFFCYVCRKNFTSVKLYDAHLTEHPAECFTCGKKFHRWKNFSLHLKRHLGWKEFECNVCAKKFVVRSALVEHTRMHTGQTPLKCKICGKNFKRYSNLTQHRKRHGKQIIRKKEYVCYCGEVLPSKARFLWHKETHDAKPKCCPHCCDRFVHANSLRRHIRLAHSDKFDYTEPMECTMCNQTFAKSSLKAHMATHSTDTQHDCNICNKSFSTKWNLKIHKWVHANRTTKPFKCEHCPKAFVREVDFKNHMNAHKQIKPYTCEHCGCKFIRKYNYMRHRREHHGNKKFTCDLCKKSFHRHYYLIEHRRIHTGERPFQCTICGKSSTTKTNHNKHLKIHHSRDPFTVEA